MWLVECFEDTTVHRYLEGCSVENKEKVVAPGTLVVPEALKLLEVAPEALKLLEVAPWSPEAVLAALESLGESLVALELLAVH